MRPHHQRAIDRAVERFSKEEGCLAVMVVGSVARGVEHDGSDIDVMVLLTEEAFAAKQRAGGAYVLAPELADYPGGFVEATFLPLSYLKLVEEKANEPSRCVFERAIVPYCAMDGLEELLQHLTAYPVAEKQQRIDRFYTKFMHSGWLATEGLNRKDRYLTWHAVSDLVLFGGRLILAHNEILFPSHKHLREALESAPEKPERLIEFMDALLETPTLETVGAYFLAVRNFREWSTPPDAWMTWHLQDLSLWLSGRPNAEDL